MTVAEVACIGQACASADEALSLVASLETGSEHPAAQAIVAAAAQRQLPVGTVRQLRAFPGEGAVGQVSLDGGDRMVAVGTADFMTKLGLRRSDGQLATAAPATGATIVYAGWDGEVRAAVSLSDTLRPEARAAVAQLVDMGIAASVLSGDRGPVVRELAERLQLQDVRGECTPETKIAEIRRAREEGGVVGMVGDGINDAPPLAEADLGIALSGGTELAKQASDVTLMGDDLSRLPWLFRLSRRTYQVIRQNLLWAFGYNLVMMTIAFLGCLHPLLAALLMMGSSLFVTHNSLKLARYPDPRPQWLR